MIKRIALCITFVLGLGPGRLALEPPTSAAKRLHHPTGTALSYAKVSCSRLSIAVGPSVSPETGEHALIVVLTNRLRRSCEIIGYPTVSLLSDAQKTLPFHYLHEHSQYNMTTAPPKRITLPPDGHAYVLLTKYRCDLGDRADVALLQLAPPGTSAKLRLALPSYPSQSALLTFCKGGQSDPGNIVSISPVEPSVRQLFQRF